MEEDTSEERPVDLAELPPEGRAAHEQLVDAMTNLR